jgi:hypothetical protein
MFPGGKYGFHTADHRDPAVSPFHEVLENRESRFLVIDRDQGKIEDLRGQPHDTNPVLVTAGYVPLQDGSVGSNIDTASGQDHNP